MLGRLGEVVGKGLVAGLAGTAMITLSSTVEAKIRKRPPSQTPANAALKVLRLQPVDDRAKKRLSTVVHWSYGTGWGSVRGLLELMGLRGAAATAVFFSAVFGTGLIILPKLEVAPPVKEWGLAETTLDAFHHLVYACTTGIVYDHLDR